MYIDFLNNKAETWRNTVGGFHCDKNTADNPSNGLTAVSYF
jgi:hypothetical protein